MSRVLRTQVCVAGGGPAGMVHALLLARAGIDVVVLEKHNDFLRDFRGDTVHPSTLRIIDELGLIDEFLRLPHTKVDRLAFDTDGTLRTFGNFSALKWLGFKQPYIALMPQWDFLDFLAEKASAYPEFTLVRNAEVTDVIVEGDRVIGVRTPELEVHAELVVGADGRRSAVRAAAGLQVGASNSPIDVLWFRLKWRPGDPQELVGVIRKGLMMAMIYRGDYWQVAYIFPKGRTPATDRWRRSKSGWFPYNPTWLSTSTTCTPGTTPVNWMCGWTDSRPGGGRACCVSAMPRTQCHRPAGSASTSR